MLEPNAITRAVDLQQRSYLLLRWVAEAVDKGFIQVETAHEYYSLPEATQEWILGHYLNIPADARPEKSDLPDFCALFATYLTNSFELVEHPGKQLYSPDDHGFCPFCGFLVDAPRLKARKPTAADKRKAQKLKTGAVRAIAAEQRVVLPDEVAMGIARDPDLREVVSAVAYAQDLLGRLKGTAVGAASLVLWRGFAWNDQGSPKKKFSLSPELLLSSEERLRESVIAAATGV